VIQEVLIEGEAQRAYIEPDSTHAEWSKLPAEPALLRVPPGKQRFEFHYAGLSFTAPEKVRFEYKLEGLEEDWVDAGTRRAALYSYLQPGNYRFHVRACNNDGVWNDAGVSLGLIVLPHFWQTWWFRLLAGLGVLLLFVAGYEIRLGVDRRLALLRLRVARDLHDEVGSNLGSIALLTEVISKQRNAPSAEVGEIRRVAVQTIDSLRDIVWFLDPAGDDMRNLVLRMKDAARTLLPGIPFEFRSAGPDSSVPSLEFRRNVFPVFKEILHNVAKHASATRVEIGVTLGLRQFELRVHDNGVGFGESQVRLGNGLKNLRRRAAELRGKVTIESRTREGTTVTFTAPIT
jgi:hypothetical protein